MVSMKSEAKTKYLSEVTGRFCSLFLLPGLELMWSLAKIREYQQVLHN